MTVRYKELYFKVVRLALLFVKLINEPHTTILCKIGKRNLTPEQASQTMKPQPVQKNKNYETTRQRLLKEKILSYKLVVFKHSISCFRRIK